MTKNAELFRPLSHIFNKMFSTLAYFPKACDS